MRFSPTWSMTSQGWLVLFASSPSLSLLFIHFSINSFSLCLCWRCPGITLTYKRQSQKWNSLKKIISSGRRTTLLGRLWLEKGLGCSDVRAVSCHVAGKLDRMKEERWTEMCRNGRSSCPRSRLCKLAKPFGSGLFHNQSSHIFLQILNSI